MPSHHLIALVAVSSILLSACTGARTGAVMDEPARTDGRAAEPLDDALDILVRLAVTDDSAEVFAYAAGALMVEMVVPNGRYFEPGGMVSFAPPEWEWALENREDPQLLEVLKAVESRGLPAREVFEAFLQNGPEGLFEDDVDKVTVENPGVPPPSRRELLCALGALSNEQGPAALEAGLHLAARLLGVDAHWSLEDAEEVTVDSVAALGAEIEAAACAHGRDADRLLGVIEAEICNTWDLWAQYPGTVPEPEHHRGCAHRRHGSDGTACTVTDNENGTYTLSCDDGTVVIFRDGEPGSDAPCTMTDNEDGTYTLVCLDGSAVTFPGLSSSDIGE